ncbi:MAG: hypothetical protein HW405_793 [Candidatus Berkelbacteria bacterium]|nr:hypothetical protein [Candidatus Berkelbacteria bacterium]
MTALRLQNRFLELSIIESISHSSDRKKLFIFKELIKLL